MSVKRELMTKKEVTSAAAEEKAEPVQAQKLGAKRLRRLRQAKTEDLEEPSDSLVAAVLQRSCMAMPVEYSEAADNDDGEGDHKEPVDGEGQVCSGYKAMPTKAAASLDSPKAVPSKKMPTNKPLLSPKKAKPPRAPPPAHLLKEATKKASEAAQEWERERPKATKGRPSTPMAPPKPISKARAMNVTGARPVTLLPKPPSTPPPKVATSSWTKTSSSTSSHTKRGGWFTKAQSLSEAILHEQHDRARELAEDYYAGKAEF